jgi:hypothetical protein
MSNPHLPLAERLLSNIEISPGGCWVWRGMVNKDGYGRIRAYGKRVFTHRVAYELLVGPIPEGLTIDHICGHHRCLCPDHLEPTTGVENVLRGGNSAKTHCIHGHAFDEENTHYAVNLKQPHRPHIRQCKECMRTRQHIRRALPRV